MPQPSGTAELVPVAVPDSSALSAAQGQYQLVLFSVPWLRKISHLKLLKWIPMLNPIFDAHLAPLKDRHHYWFGVLLVIPGILLATLALTYAI